MQALFGGTIAIVLLGIYLHLIRLGWRVVDCLTTVGCTKYGAGFFNDGMAQALSIVGGLVSALVSAELAPGSVAIAAVGIVLAAINQLAASSAPRNVSILVTSFHPGETRRNLEFSFTRETERELLTRPRTHVQRNDSIRARN